MPGIVLHNRRWGVGSDDCIVPASLLTITHLVWLVILVPVIVITFTEEQVQEADSGVRRKILLCLNNGWMESTLFYSFRFITNVCSSYMFVSTPYH